MGLFAREVCRTTLVLAVEDIRILDLVAALRSEDLFPIVEVASDTADAAYSTNGFRLFPCR